MTTIRLSDRLTIEHSAEAGCHARLTNYKESITDDLCEAIVALANPPRYDLPPGIEPGYVLKAGNPLPVGWEGQNGTGSSWVPTSFPNEGIPWDPRKDRLVRPTAANPLQPLPDHTFRLPDGELACYRRDAAKLREAGATLRTMTGITPAADYDRHHPDQVLLVEFPAPPETKRVHWVVALRGQLPLTHNSGPITSYIARPDARATNPVGIDLGPEGDGDNRCVCPDALGKVEVLASDGAL